MLRCGFYCNDKCRELKEAEEKRKEKGSQNDKNYKSEREEVIREKSTNTSEDELKQCNVPRKK